MSETELQTIKENPKENQIFRKVEDAINEVRKGKVAGVYEDSYKDQINPNYIVFYDKDRLDRFEEVFKQAKNLPDVGRQKIFDKLDKLAGLDVEISNLFWIYRNEEWAIPPESLIDDAVSMRLQEEDNDWFEAQRKHFTGI